MSFVPLDGPATLAVATPPRSGEVTFTGGSGRTITFAIRGAVPILTKARARDDLHPSVALLSGAVLLAMRVVAAGRFEPDPAGGAWRPVPLDGADLDQVRRLAAMRAAADPDDPVEVAEAEATVQAVLAAVVDAMPSSPPSQPSAPAAAPGRSFSERLQSLAGGSGDPADTAEEDRPQLVALSFRVEAAEEDLALGSVRVVPQVHDQVQHLHVADAAALWQRGTDHGFGSRARTHATLELRRAAEAWPPLERLLDLRVPDEIALDSDELGDLLEHGVAALGAAGFDVLWPRALGRDLTARAHLRAAREPDPGTGDRGDADLVEPVFGQAAVFSFDWQIALHEDPLTPEEMDTLATAASPIIKLRDNWMVVDPAIARRARSRMIRRVTASEALAATLTGELEVGPRGDTAVTEVVLGASLEQVRARLREDLGADTVPVPRTLDASLRAYQREGLTWLARLTDLGLGACLADDMGLGKTITLIALHLHRAETHPHAAAGPGPTLVVCPTSLLGNWEAEIRRFAPGVAVRRFHGSRRDLEGLTEGFVLTTYGTARNAEELAEVTWGLVVADEAQHIKNARTATARAMRRLTSGARVALTGTPVENELSELWAILDWCIPGLLGSRNAFRRRWAAPIEAGVDPRVVEQFAGLIEPFLLRRRKSDPGIAPELPPKTETDHLVGLTREQTVLYEALVRDAMERIEAADPDARRGLVLKMLTGCKQICNHPAHYLRQAHAALAGRSYKLDLLDELLATILAEGGATLIFTQYVEMGRLICSHLDRAEIGYEFLHGGVSAARREEMVQRFQAGQAPVFVLSLRAGGTGLNLTRADHVVHFDRWWNPAVEDQATDRAYRIGQTRPVQVHRLVTEGTVEQRVGQMLESKRSLAEAVLGSGEQALTELSNAELRDLVALRPSAEHDGEASR